MKALVQEMREWDQGWFQYLRYSWYLTLWLYQMRWMRVVVFLKRHAGVIRRFALVAAAVGAGLLANYFGTIALSGNDLSGYLVAAAAMTGGAIAIIFSISIFLLQGVADLYSSKHFEEYTNNWRDQVVYLVVIVITFGLFATALYVGGVPAIIEEVSSRIVLTSLAFIGLVFALIDWQYALVRKKVNPFNAIAFLQGKGLRFLAQLQKNAGKVARLLGARDATLTPDMALAAAYNHVMQPLIDDLDRQLETLIELSLKLSDRQEVETTKQALNAVHFLLVKFLEARKTSSLAIPSATTFLAVESDSQTFLAKNFARLNKAGDKFIKENNDVLAAHIVDIYRALAVAAKEVQFIRRSNENPILDLLIGYLGYHTEAGQAAKNIEVVFQGNRVLGDIAVMATEKGLHPTLHGLQQRIMKIAVFGLGEKQNLIFDQSNLIFLKIIRAVFAYERIERRQAFDDALKNIAKIAMYISTFRKTGVVPSDLATSFSSSKGYDEMYAVLVEVVNRYSTLTDDREKRRYRGDLVEFFREINMTLRNLSEKVRECDTVLADSIGRLLYYINNLIVDLIEHPDFAREKQELENRLGWNIHLPTWFAHHAEKFDGGSNHFSSLTDSIAKTGILVAERLGNKKLAKDSIEALYSMTNHTLQKTTSGYGYDEPRVLEKACYLGILALKKGWMDIVADLKVKIQEYEAKYYAKHLTNLPAGLPAGFDPRNHRIMGLPHHDQLLRELYIWRHDFESERRNGMLRMRDDAQAMMYEVIERVDIDWFIFEIWQQGDDDSPIWEIMETKEEREKLVRVLAAIASIKPAIVKKSSPKTKKTKGRKGKKRK